MFKTKVDEAAYVGNIGAMELVKFHRRATPKQKKQLQSHIANKKHEEFRNLIKQVTGVQLHKSVNEKQEFVSKAGAGEEGRAESVNKYKKDTPGQNIASFKDYMKTKY
jgi:ABC-type transporter MlaC component